MTQEAAKTGLSPVRHGADSKCVLLDANSLLKWTCAFLHFFRTIMFLS